MASKLRMLRQWSGLFPQNQNHFGLRRSLLHHIHEVEQEADHHYSDQNQDLRCLDNLSLKHTDVLTQMTDIESGELRRPFLNA